MLVSVPYGKTFIDVEIPVERLEAVLTPGSCATRESGEVLVRKALENPIGGGRLRDLAVRASKIVIISSDHTRPLPSQVTMPAILEEIKEANPRANITILIATGLHRAPTYDELIQKYGQQIVKEEHIVSHDASDDNSLVRLRDLPSGAPCSVNRLAYDADLLVAEGFIEPHFFAGFSGGRKSILPGISGRETVLFNHSAQLIDHPCSIAGKLDNNLINEDMVAASSQIGLNFILNVAIGEDKNIIAAFAGDPVCAFKCGAAFVDQLSRVYCKKSDIVVTSNGGYPLDQNLYQIVKGISTAKDAVKTGGVIISVAACEDGIGGDSFYRILKQGDSQDILSVIRATSPADTLQDQWQVQVLVRVLQEARIIMVTEGIAPDKLRDMGLEWSASLSEALTQAYAYTGDSAKVVIIPNGAGITVEGYE